MLMRRARFATLLLLTACGGKSSSTGPTATAASITLSTTTVSLSSLNQTQALTATVLDAGGATIAGAAVTWSTNTSSVATVSTGGVITAVGNGTAQITAASGSAQATANVTVQQVAATLSLTPDTLRLAAAGDTATIGRTVRDALGSTMTGVPVTFATSNPSVATVGVATGKVTAAGDGATTVIAQVAPGGSNLTKQIRVEVGGVLPPAYLRGGYVGTAYADTIGPVSGGGGGFTFAVTAGALPNNLTLNASGAISGTPSASGAFFFQVTASNGTLTLSERYAITISTKSAAAFNLWLTYDGGPMPPANAQTAVSAALARFEQLITGDLPTRHRNPSQLLTRRRGVIQQRGHRGFFHPHVHRHPRRTRRHAGSGRTMRTRPTHFARGDHGPDEARRSGRQRRFDDIPAGRDRARARARARPRNALAGPDTVRGDR